ncbi:hypothetical protein [Cohnella sp. GCM10012308]|uniref:hypothetical protein n=1 Tax=Cohnella sp. GCM10012308 TaxID=3317329 RepID=UPI00360F84EF
MNIDTGELRLLGKDQQVPENFERVPRELSAAAKKKLADREFAVVRLASGGKLSKWARRRRKEKKKAAQASRRQNRGH